MRSQATPLPVVLAIGGHDPSGGAGIQADIEAVAANGAHAVTLISCLTLQDSCDVRALQPIEPGLLARQAALLLADSRVAAIKLGLMGSPQAAETVAGVLRGHPGVPVVLDPVLAAGGGSELAGQQLLQRLRGLLPLCDLVTPNIPEAVRLSGLAQDAGIDEYAGRLLELGAKAVLITGTHDPAMAPRITHRLYRPGLPVRESEWPRLPGEYHGSGCTLAAAIAARLALGEPMERAIEQALDFTWRSLRHAFASGRCQATPDRLFALARTGHATDG